jgi:hypothetical protein
VLLLGLGKVKTSPFEEGNFNTGGLGELFADLDEPASDLHLVI